MTVSYDLHIHSCLSPCASDDMTPGNIAGMAVLAGLNAVAIADHNSTKNCAALCAAACEYGILAVPAMELCTREEVHVLCLLPDIPAADALCEYVYSKIIFREYPKKMYGRQLLVGKNDEITGEESVFLGSAADIGVYECAELLRGYGGIALPAHINRNSFSIISNLGFIDKNMGFSAAELSLDCDAEKFRSERTDISGLKLIADSDAHDLDMIPDASRTLETDTMSARGIIRALGG